MAVSPEGNALYWHPVFLNVTFQRATFMEDQSHSKVENDLLIASPRNLRIEMLNAVDKRPDDLLICHSLQGSVQRQPLDELKDGLVSAIQVVEFVPVAWVKGSHG